jgi:glycosyltransferase involved in cell wall biosynthesis
VTDLHVGCVVGTRLPGNVRTFLGNVRRLLADADLDVQFDLLLREDAADDPFADAAGSRPTFEVVDPGLADTDRALATVGTLVRSVTAYATEADPDLLWQVTKFPVHGFATTIAGKRAGVPVLTRFAGDNFREYTLAASRAERARTFVLNNAFGRVPAAFSEATMALGPYGRDQIERRGGSDVREIPQPVDRERFGPPATADQTAIRDELGLPADGRVLLTVGRVSRRKGMLDLLDAAATLARRDADVTWCVVGTGPLESRLASAPVVSAVGRVPHDEIVRYYQAADLVVHPSLIEGLPNVLLEAATCETPTLARDVGDAAVAASATYDDAAQLPDLVEASYDPVSLDDRFDPDTLRQAYVDVLVDTAAKD